MKIETDTLEKIRILFVEAKLLELFDVFAKAINFGHIWVTGDNEE